MWSRRGSTRLTLPTGPTSGVSMYPDDLTPLLPLAPLLTGAAFYIWRTEITTWWRAVTKEAGNR